MTVLPAQPSPLNYPGIDTLFPPTTLVPALLIFTWLLADILAPTPTMTCVTTTREWSAPYPSTLFPMIVLVSRLATTLARWDRSVQVSSLHLTFPQDIHHPDTTLLKRTTLPDTFNICRPSRLYHKLRRLVAMVIHDLTLAQ